LTIIINKITIYHHIWTIFWHLQIFSCFITCWTNTQRCTGWMARGAGTF